MQFIDFKPIADFVDRTGKIRPIAACSLIGRDEFFERLEQIQNRLQQETSMSWEELYDVDNHFRYLIDRCLKLNNIKPNWVSLNQVEMLLLHRQDENGEWVAGWLFSLNKPKQSQSESKNSVPMSTEETIALIASQPGSSLTDAIGLASTVPANPLIEMVSAQSDLSDPKRWQKRKAKPRKPMTGDEFEQLMSIPVEKMEAIV